MLIALAASRENRTDPKTITDCQLALELHAVAQQALSEQPKFTIGAKERQSLSALHGAATVCVTVFLLHSMIWRKNDKEITIHTKESNVPPLCNGQLQSLAVHLTIPEV